MTCTKVLKWHATRLACWRGKNTPIFQLQIYRLSTPVCPDPDTSARFEERYGYVGDRAQHRTTRATGRAWEARVFLMGNVTVYALLNT